jgi:hypothetical protein
MDAPVRQLSATAEAALAAAGRCNLERALLAQLLTRPQHG